ncbi:MAG TPA: NAD(P)/FAD-dependent oxidoreductase [Phycisphaerales bacterium]|nr:NAD(P)/FAD-dependent oxidoreductase [Phycisphaerales bacterium]
MKSAYDVVIAGGGPAGSTAALVLARQGFSVCVLEKDRHPRFHIGESILPRTTPLLQELGIEQDVLALTHVPKYGAEFGWGNDHKTRRFSFSDGLIPGSVVFNIERAKFDKLLLDKARQAGAEVFEGRPVKSITRLNEGDVEVQTAEGPVIARLLLDASGHGTVVGRHLNLRRNFQDPELQKVAYFQHFENVERPAGKETGHPGIFMCAEGWFWVIGLSGTKTSVGFVTRPSFVKTLDIPPQRLLQWAVARCPVVRDRMRNATGPADNVILADFSYRCRPYAGPGYFMIGDAACFLDPIFSTGVTLAMMGSSHCAGMAARVLRGQMPAQRARRAHIRYVERGTAPFWRLIRAYYKHPFRELFMHGTGPHQIPAAIISVLAGQVFPQQPWKLRWRHRLFDLCIWLQQHRELSPHRPPFHLVAEAPVDLPLITGGSTLEAKPDTALTAAM